MAENYHGGKNTFVLDLAKILNKYLQDQRLRSAEGIRECGTQSLGRASLPTFRDQEKLWSIKNWFYFIIK
jgi:hypothetical protein